MSSSRDRGGRDQEYGPEEAAEHEPEEEGRWPGRKTLTQFLPSRSVGQALPGDLRARLSESMGSDVPDVRLHTGPDAAAAAQSINARAFTVGQDVYFGAGEYAPDSAEGRKVIAHEVAHAVQQRGADVRGAEPLEISQPGDSHEVEADSFADSFATPRPAPATPDLAGPSAAGLSPAMMAARPPVRPVQAGVVSRAKIHRLAAGTLEIREFSPNATPMGPGEWWVAGVGAGFEFHPGNKVDARDISFIQTVISQKKGKPHNIGTTPKEKDTLDKRKIPAAEGGGGASIDRDPNMKSPVYGKNNDGGMNTGKADPNAPAPKPGQAPRMGARSNQQGHRFMDNGVVQEKSAQMYDWPHLEEPGSDSHQKFETAVVALSGTQAGSYYGTVTWGWEIDGSGNFSVQKPVEKDGDPSPTFQRAAQVWNEGTSAQGEKNEQIPIPLERDADKLDTPALITRIQSESDPMVKAVLRHCLARRPMQIEVTGGKNADWVGGAADVFIKINGKKATGIQPCPDGGRTSFSVPLGELASGSLGTIQIAAMDEDVVVDEQLATLAWASPYTASTATGKNGYTVSAKFIR